MAIEPKMTKNVLLNAVSRVLGQVSKIKDLSCLVIENFEIALNLALNNRVVYITDDPKCANMFRQFTKCACGNDDQVFLINNWKNKLKFNKIWCNMKFNLAVMNPPYERNLHLKILEAVIPHAEKVVNISPVRWLQDPFAKYLNTSDYKKFEESISKKIETLDVIDAKTASTIFDANFIMNLGIYVCGNGGYNYDMETPLIKKIIKKTMENSWAEFSQRKFYDNNCIQIKPYILNVSAYNSENNVLNKTYKSQCDVKLMNRKSVYTGGDGTASCHFEFDTEIERKNFYDCYNHRFMHWYIGKWKIDIHVKSFKVPYFGDYTKPWTTKMFCDYFDITGYIDDEHAVSGSEWEEIMKQW